MIPGVKVTLGGTEWVLPPLNLRALIELQPRLAGFRPGAIDADSLRLIVETVHRALLRNYPDLEEAFVAEYVDMGNMLELFTATMDVSGMRRKAQEAAAAGETAATTSGAGRESSGTSSPAQDGGTTTS